MPTAKIHIFNATLSKKYTGLLDKADSRIEFKVPGLKNVLSTVKTKEAKDAGKHPEFHEDLELKLDGTKGYTFFSGPQN